MISDFISITNLQKTLRSVFDSKQQPIRIVLSNNSVSGMVFSKEATELLMNSQMLEQIKEELWELNDPETREAVALARRGDSKHKIDFDAYLQKYELQA